MAIRGSKTTGVEGPTADGTDGVRVTARTAAAVASLVADTRQGGEEASAPPAATVVSETAVVAGPELKKKDLIDRVVTRSGLKRRDVKPAVEAMLAELGAAVQAGEELNLPPFGKLKITRSKDVANARIFHCRLRQAEAGPPAAEPLAEDDEEG